MTKTNRALICLVHVLIGTSTAATALAKDAKVDIKIAAERFAAQQPEALRPYFRALYIEGEHNAVLNFDYLGLAALESGNYEIAERALDAAITRIDAVYADNPNAKKARSLFAEEKTKDFKGEPYERAMTYFYRGLLYVRRGDYQNARASFLAAEQQSMLSEQESYASTFGLMDFLAGWASYCDGDDGRAVELGSRAAGMQPDAFSSLKVTSNFIGLIDVGTGPAKIGIGKYHERLSFKPTETPAIISDVTAKGVTLSVPVVGTDLNWQATTRGGRPVDAVLNGKAQWKSNTEGASSALTAVGYGTTLQGLASNNNNVATAGEIGMAIGLVGGLFANAMTPAADTRSWSTLPAQIVLTTSPEIGEATSLGYRVDGSTQNTSFAAHAGKCAIAWGRTRSSSPSSLREPVQAESKREAVNAQMRTTLESTFSGIAAEKLATNSQ